MTWLRSVELDANKSRRLKLLFDEHEGAGPSSVPTVRHSVEKTLQETRSQATELQFMRERRLIADDEFAERRAVLKLEIERLAGRLEELARPLESIVIPPLKIGISLNNQAAYLFEHGDDELRRRIVRTACSNPRLTNKILSVEAAKWLAALLELGRCPAVRRRRDSNSRGVLSPTSLAVMRFRPLTHVSVLLLYVSLRIYSNA